MCPAASDFTGNPQKSRKTRPASLRTGRRCKEYCGQLPAEASRRIGFSGSPLPLPRSESKAQAPGAGMPVQNLPRLIADSRNPYRQALSLRMPVPAEPAMANCIGSKSAPTAAAAMPIRLLSVKDRTAARQSKCENPAQSAPSSDRTGKARTILPHGRLSGIKSL